MSPKKPTLRVAVSASLAKALPPVLSRVKALMDLACHPAEVAQALGALAKRHPGLRVPGAFDGFEMAVRAILGQQVTVAAARTDRGPLRRGVRRPDRDAVRFAHDAVSDGDACRGAAATDASRASACPARAPAPSSRSRARWPTASSSSCRTPTSRRRSTGCARCPASGEWTAQYIAMRALAWPDAFPHTDLGVMKALGETDARRVLAAGEAWRPWRAYAVMHLWQSLQRRNETMRYYDFYESPHGRMLLVASDEGLSGVYFDGQKYSSADRSRSGGAMRATRRCARRSASWPSTSRGERKRFEIALAPEGTPFQRSVWKAISTVGFGKTITYGELARRAGCPGSARAAGAATGRNPLTHHRSLPPHRRLERQPDGLRGRPGEQARAARARGRRGLQSVRTAEKAIPPRRYSTLRCPPTQSSPRST